MSSMGRVAYPTYPHPPTLPRWDPLTPHPLRSTNNYLVFKTPPVTKQTGYIKNIYLLKFHANQGFTLVRNLRFFTIISVFFTIRRLTLSSIMQSIPYPPLIPLSILYISNSLHRNKIGVQTTYSREL